MAKVRIFKSLGCIALFCFTGVIYHPLALAREMTAKEIFKSAENYAVLISASNSSKKTQGSGIVYISGHSKKTSNDFTYILTNAHVAADFKEVTVATKKSKYVGEVVIYDKNIDLALVRIDGVILPKAKSLNDSGGHLAVGDKVFAIGSPIGMKNSLSEGIVSGLREHKGVTVIQTTAPISHGSSGGGLFDVQGNLVGITTFKLIEGENLNFAVDIRHAEDLLSDKKTGQAAKGNEKAEAAATLDGLQPDWREIVDSTAFRNWMKTLPKDEQDKLSDSWEPYFISDKITEFKKTTLTLICHLKDPTGNGEMEFTLNVDIKRGTINNTSAQIYPDEFVQDSIHKATGDKERLSVSRSTGFATIYTDKFGFLAKGYCAKSEGVKF